MRSMKPERTEDELYVAEQSSMGSRLAGKVRDAAAQAAQWGSDVERVKTAVAEAVSGKVEEGVRTTKRAAKASIEAAADLTDETIYRIKRRPLRAVGITLGIGFALGAFFGWSAFRRGRAESKGD